MPSAAARLEVRGLGLERGRRRIFRSLDLVAPAGTLIHLKGPNGCGKTSLLRALAGLTPLAAGNVVWREQTTTAGLGAQAHYVGHQNGLSAVLSARENLAFFLALRGAQHDYARIAIALAEFNAADFADRAVKLLSAGQRQRVALARLKLVDCPVWLLDEPFTALDTATRGVLETAIDEQLDAGGVVLLATHQPFTTRHPQTAVELSAASAS